MSEHATKLTDLIVDKYEPLGVRRLLDDLKPEGWLLRDLYAELFDQELGISRETAYTEIADCCDVYEVVEAYFGDDETAMEEFIGYDEEQDAYEAERYRKEMYDDVGAWLDRNRI